MATRSPSSRERLLEAAKRLFAAQGYEQTATSAIAREAGTSESQLMRYFGGKVGLLEALFDDAWNHLNARVARALKTADGHRESLLDAIQTIVSVLARDPDLATLFMFEGRRMRGDEPRVRLSRGFVAFSDTIRSLVRRAQAAREINPGFDASAVTSALLGAAESLIRDRLSARSGRGGRSFAEREIRRTLDGMLSGLQSRPRSGRAPVAKKR
ncbi:MAG TPA: helix-turn-helix domain-containing protein [Vicinamibacterales bacterium]|nr:helix-turn-helix domain-containing protein [Vicinamibacterales bacterium]